MKFTSKGICIIKSNREILISWRFATLTGQRGKDERSEVNPSAPTDQNKIQPLARVVFCFSEAPANLFAKAFAENKNILRIECRFDLSLLTEPKGKDQRSEVNPSAPTKKIEVQATPMEWLLFWAYTLELVLIGICPGKENNLGF